jgi:DNA-binding MarR family transcriptional regulator
MTAARRDALCGRFFAVNDFCFFGVHFVDNRFELDLYIFNTTFIFGFLGGGSGMILTGRRKQFLQKLIDLYKKTNVPVHYKTLAKALGVSKWTAYDMLKELEKLGYLARDYAVNPGETGRSQIVFRPTAKAASLFEQIRADVINPEEWRQIKTKVLAFLNSLKSCSLSDAIQKVLEEIPKAQVRIAFCAYIIGLLLVYLHKLGGRTESMIKSLVQSAPTNEMRMTIFVGTVLGTIIQKMNHEIGIEATNLVGRYLKSITDLSEHERGMLSDFLTEALA